MTHDHPHDPSAGPDRDRRAILKLLAGVALTPALGACAAAGSTERPPIARPRPMPTGPSGAWKPLGNASTSSGSVTLGSIRAIPRSSWAKGQPVPTLMNRMLPIRRITVHHDAAGVFTDTRESATAARLESIRRGHRGRGFGDIGYHLLIDPAGRVWEGRPIAWQGAHVGGQNQNNLGICVMGHYSQQSPNSAQQSALASVLGSAMRDHRLAVSSVHTHRELAPTACPGTHLQRVMDSLRVRGGVLVSA